MNFGEAEEKFLRVLMPKKKKQKSGYLEKGIIM